jgi:hypothetical protein
MEFTFNIQEKVVPAAQAHIEEALIALQKFLTSSNETATEHGNALAKNAGIARKLIIKPAPKIKEQKAED